jgi:hypothetical protein
MLESYNLFKKDENGDLVWVDTIQGLKQVKARLIKLSSIKPGTYIIYDFKRAKLIEPLKKSH